MEPNQLAVLNQLVNMGRVDRYAPAMAATSPDLRTMLESMGAIPTFAQNVQPTQAPQQQVRTQQPQPQAQTVAAPQEEDITNIISEMSPESAAQVESEGVPSWLTDILTAALGIAPAVAAKQVVSSEVPAIEDGTARAQITETKALPPPDTINQRDVIGDKFRRDKAVPYTLKDGTNIFLQNGVVYDENGKQIAKATEEFIKANFPEEIRNILRSIKTLGRI